MDPGIPIDLSATASEVMHHIWMWFSDNWFSAHLRCVQNVVHPLHRGTVWIAEYKVQRGPSIDKFYTSSTISWIIYWLLAIKPLFY